MRRLCRCAVIKSVSWKCNYIIRNLVQVIVPRTYPNYTSRKVLTTGWIDGEKLSQSTESDVGELVNVGVICYLKQVMFWVLLIHALRLTHMLPHR